MELYLFRHGAAEQPEPGQPDSERSLTAEGEKTLRTVLKTAMRAGAAPSLILTSPYKRAMQTAQIAADVLNYRGDLLQTNALLPSSTPAAVWQEIRVHRDEGRFLAAGHDPLFTKLAGYLLGFPSLRIDFKKGALLRIDFDKFPPEPHGTLIWMLEPALVEPT